MTVTARAMAREVFFFFFPFLLASAACLAAVWFCERALIMLLPGLASTSFSQAAASLLVFALGTSLVGVFFWAAFLYLARRPLEPIFPGVPAKLLAPVWWARWLLGSIGFIALFQLGVMLWRFGHHLQGVTLSLSQQQDAASLSWVVAWSSIFASGVMVATDAAGRFLGRTRRWAASSVLVWSSFSALCGLWSALGYAMILIASALAMKPGLMALGFGSPLNTTYVIAALAIAARLGWEDVKETWQGRSTAMSDATSPTPPLSRNDFWNWDIESETSVSGISGNGYPFFLWRESADNRIGLSRPRYCCLLKEDDELHLAFFNPSEDVKPTGGWVVGGMIGALVAIAMVTGLWVETPPPAAFISNQNPPAFLRFLSYVVASSLAGIVSGSVWHFCTILFRWYRNRFAQDGRLFVQPLRNLSGFDLVAASDLGAKVNGEPAKIGRGLTAVFTDGTMWSLTANAWEYPSIVRYHAALTNAFRVPRDHMLAELEAEKKRVARTASQPTAPATTANTSNVDPDRIPTTL